MMLTNSQKCIMEKCEKELKDSLRTGELPEEYYYNSIVFCLIDSIFSIGVKYSCVKKTVMNYCDNLKLERIHKQTENPSDEHTVDDYINYINKIESDDYGRETILDNRQKTSTRNGIYKAEAVYIAATVLKNRGIQRISDIREYEDIKGLECEFKKIKGQGSGISFSYFMMLAGDDNYMKIDRWLTRFVEKATGKKLDVECTYKELSAVYEALKIKYQRLTPRSFDYAIWNYSKSNL